MDIWTFGMLAVMCYGLLIGGLVLKKTYLAIIFLLAALLGIWFYIALGTDGSLTQWVAVGATGTNEVIATSSGSSSQWYAIILVPVFSVILNFLAFVGRVRKRI